MKKIRINLGIIAIIVLGLNFASCSNTVSGNVQYQAVSGSFRPDVGAEIYATQGSVEELLSFIEATRKYSYVWRLKDASGWDEEKYAEFEEKYEMNDSIYSKYSSAAYSAYLKLRAPLMTEEKVISTETDSNGNYSLKLKGDNWNVVYISKLLNPTGQIYNMQIKENVSFIDSHKDINIQFERKLYEALFNR